MSGLPESNWEGMYPSFEAAKAESTVFEGDVWLDKVVARAKSALERSTGGAIPPVATTTEYALPFVAAMAAKRGQPLRVLDFGGGLGTSYPPLRGMLPKEQPVDFVVVENEAVCARGRDVFAALPEVRFVSELPKPPERFDLVHFGSSLHYVDDWRGVLRAAAALRPQHMLFADLTAADNRSLVTVQRFHGRRIPVRFWNVDEFIAALAELGFGLVFKSRYRGYYVDPNAELPTKQFPPEYRLTYMSQLVFRSRAEE